MLQFHQGAEFDGILRTELFHGELLEFGDGGFDLRRLTGLAAGEVGGLEAAGVVFALGPAGLMCGLGAGELGGAKINRQLLGEFGDDLLQQDALIHLSRQSVPGGDGKSTPKLLNRQLSP